MQTYLDGIIAWHRARAAADERDPGAVTELARRASESDPPRPFEAALRRDTAVAVIAEIKRRSPSKGELDGDLDASLTARQYEQGGASGLSVLTDLPHFGGSAEDLAAARSAVSIPVLRKDFTVSATDVYDARIMGADAALLIASVLSDDELSSFAATATSLGMSAVIEVHDEQEAERVLAMGARVVGVNQRDLRTFEIDAARAIRVAAKLPASVLKIAESGIRGPTDISELAAAGYDAVLVGETFIRSADRTAAVRALSNLSSSGAR